MTPEDDQLFIRLGELGFGAPYIAREFGRRKDWAQVHAKRLGVDLPRGRNVFPNYRSRVEEMKPIDAVAYLLSILDHALVDPLEKDMVPLLEHGFSRREARVLCALMDEDDHTLSKGCIFAHSLLYCDNPDDPPSVRFADMLILRIRRKLGGLNWPLRITTLRGYGYRLDGTEGFEIPA